MKGILILSAVLFVLISILIVKNWWDNRTLNKVFADAARKEISKKKKPNP